jgi:phytoene/squalene synthetase
MQYDLEVTEYTTKEAYENYIYGSADVVGLMCLRVFVDNDNEKFNHLKSSAKYLGSAFQKVNFLRDIKQDLESLGRSYFPNVQQKELTDEVKKEIIADIEEDFEKAFQGLVQLPIESRLGVYIAYKYYSKLLKKLKYTKSEKILTGRIHISNPMKMVILAKGYVRYKLNAI